ncbi:MAG TPA: glycosyltransferase family 4 protein [Ktedonobacteraceae bacterium]|jgi:glycosyltransferase involved in cell wall biosynthesis|nr:glycosyltransferase family 4 protein [Ktedonobacteraceae bacterium]
MRIAHIAPPWLAIPPKNYGGTEIVLYNLIEEQVSQGHEVTLFAPADARTSAKLISFFPQSLIESGIPWQAHLKAYYHLYKAVEYVKSHPFDILHTHLSSAADMYIFPLTAHLALPHLTTLHSRFPFDRVASWTGDADRLYLEWMAAVPMVAVSESARDEVPYALNFVGVVHHGVPMQIFRPTTGQPEDFCVWLGRITPDKGTHLAIKAAKMAEVPLVLAGTVDCHVPEDLQYFEETIKPELDNHRVTYIGPVNLEQKIDLLSRARVFLNPIQWEEPFGMVMIEALALGCPVISFARGAASEIVVHRRNGFLAHDVEEMAQFIPMIERLDRTAIRAHAEQRFSARVMSEKYVALYKKVIAACKAKLEYAAATRLRPPLITPPPALVRTAALSQTTYQISQGPRTKAGAEPAR